jgi:hypothetical protein
MTYSSGSLILATDYNGFVSTNAGANVNDIWSTGSSDKGYGETAVPTVSTSATITATQWATLNNRIASLGSQTGTTITSRTNPVAGDTIGILAALNTDLTNCTTNRGNAVGTGSQYTTFSGSTSYTSNWSGTLTFTHTISFASADAARYFFNAGGRFKWEVNKTSTGNGGDPEWNDLANTLTGDIFFTGRVNGTSQTIAGTSYTGTQKSGGTGSPNTLATTTGWYQLTTSDTLIYRQYADSSPYTNNNIALYARTASSGTQLVFTTNWVNSEGDTTSGGSATGSPFSSFGTAPATVVTYFPPSATYLTSAAWGTPTISASV